MSGIYAAKVMSGSYSPNIIKSYHIVTILRVISSKDYESSLDKTHKRHVLWIMCPLIGSTTFYIGGTRRIRQVLFSSHLEISPPITYACWEDNQKLKRYIETIKTGTRRTLCK